ncbi:dihydrolipoyl dehydrogenase [Phaeobacter sp. SYSU ZJ3003]|uniref:dihydrolipoyl dehydrogenase n=1 Tax=Phaeobacter sp. SYSU ZJ3003 TaxID=2109330 RepID=UPI00351BF233
MLNDVILPDIGDFADVPVIEITVGIGDTVAENDPILMLESDKATLDIPAPFAGEVAEILVQEGDPVSAGTVVMRFKSTGVMAADIPNTAPAPATISENHADLVVIGAGPGGYTAAFRAADLGRKVTLIDPRATLGGVCLNEGCIPSKALLHLADLKEAAAETAAHGLDFGTPKVDLAAIREFRDSVVGKLTGGLAGLANRRKVTVIRGSAAFTGTHSLSVTTEEGQTELNFDQAIVAVGSEPVRLPFLPDDPRIIDSTGALALEDVPDRLLVIGGGIIGLEMAQVYHALGSQVEIVELADQIIPGADPDIVKPLADRIGDKYAAIRTRTKVTGVKAGASLTASFETQDGEASAEYDRILVAVGRVPNGAKVAPDMAGINCENGFLPVDLQMRTTQPHIFAIGDVVGQPMLAHKAVHEAKVAAEVACGETAAFEPAAIPSVAYTDPEVAWVGLTEAQAKAEGRKIKTAKFPWMASGRALSLARGEGVTKQIYDPETGKLLGAGVVGKNAGELIAEAALAIEMGADAHDVGLTIHPHPTLSETLGMAAEAFTGTLTDL